MKAIKRKVLITITVLAVTVTLAYAGMRGADKMSFQEIFDHPALDQMATGYYVAGSMY